MDAYDALVPSGTPDIYCNDLNTLYVDTMYVSDASPHRHYFFTYYYISYCSSITIFSWHISNNYSNDNNTISLIVMNSCVDDSTPFELSSEAISSQQIEAMAMMDNKLCIRVRDTSCGVRIIVAGAFQDIVPDK